MNNTIYQPRYRRDCLGELIQIDSSHHDWFEGRSDIFLIVLLIRRYATGQKFSNVLIIGTPNDSIQRVDHR
ncbi:hypothetical protein ACMAZD_08880 [Vibrio sp. nBUS_14]|uniref:hypothetical protein n=1 Tax=Vibrio sp. nBUS_14 TaxID=3395321 RepID=UPI003EBA2B5D